LLYTLIEIKTITAHQEAKGGHSVFCITTLKSYIDQITLPRNRPKLHY